MVRLVKLYSHPPGIRVVSWAVVTLISLVVAGCIIKFAPRMAPVRPGNAHVFWKLACDVSLNPDVADVDGGEVYFVGDIWAAYDGYHLHGSDIYCLTMTDATSDFGDVVKGLELKRERGEDNTFVQGYIHWRDDPDGSHTAPELVNAIKRAYREERGKSDVDFLAYSVASEQEFWQRWQRADWYWVNAVFEWTFLSGLVLFALWPIIRGLTAWRWALHLALVPMLFLLPTYLGYASYSFTSAGPSGGILYPHLLKWLRGGSMNAIDSFVLAHLPQVLEPLSTPIGSPMALTGLGMPGPTSAVITGLVIGGIIVGIHRAYRRYNTRSALPNHATRK